MLVIIHVFYLFWKYFLLLCWGYLRILEISLVFGCLNVFPPLYWGGWGYVDNYSFWLPYFFSLCNVGDIGGVCDLICFWLPYLVGDNFLLGILGISIVFGCQNFPPPLCWWCWGYWGYNFFYYHFPPSVMPNLESGRKTVLSRFLKKTLPLEINFVTIFSEMLEI